METSYKITLFFKDGTFGNHQTNTLDEAKKYVTTRITLDPSCCANIIIAEYEKDTPHKQSVRLERYEYRNGTIIVQNY